MFIAAIKTAMRPNTKNSIDNIRPNMMKRISRIDRTSDENHWQSNVPGYSNLEMSRQLHKESTS